MTSDRPISLWLATLIAAVFAGGSVSAQIITEVMYNPDSSEASWEWVEVHNPTGADIDLTGWVFDDDDTSAPTLVTPNIASGVIPAGGSAVLYDADALSEADFRAAWCGITTNLIPVTDFPTLGNTGDRIGLWATVADHGGGPASGNFANAVDEVFFGDGSGDPWPASTNGLSIYLTDLAADNNDPANWALSTIGGATPIFRGFMSKALGGNSGADVGSPGDAPLLAVDDAGSTDEDTPTSSVLPGTTASLLANDCGSPLSVAFADSTSFLGAAITVNPDGTFSYNPVGQAGVQALDEGQVFNDTFCYFATEAVPPNGLIDVQVVNTAGTNPGNSSDNWLAVWDALDGGAGPTGTVAGFNVQNNTADTETVFDYAGGGGNFAVNRAIGSINNDGPGGSGGPFNPGGSGGSNYSIRARTYILFPSAGTFTIGMGSDDGRRIELAEATAGSAPGYSGFASRHGQVNGAFSAGDTVLGFSGGTGHAWSRGVFTVAANDILALDAFYYEGGGGDSGEIALAAGAQTFGGSGINTTTFSLLQNGAQGVALSTSLAELQALATNDKATVTIAVTGINDAPTTAPDFATVTETANAISNPTASGNVLTNDSDLDDPNSSFTVTAVNGNAGDVGVAVAGLYGSLQIDANGAFTYTLDDASPAVDGLCEGDQVSESFNYTLSDNHSGGNAMTANGSFSVLVGGVNDRPDATDNMAAVTEDTGPTDSGNVLGDDDGSGVDSDVDGAAAALSVTAVDGTTTGTVTGAYGTLTWDEDGTYSYTANSPALQALDAGDMIFDNFTITVADAARVGDGHFNVRAFRVVGGGGSTDNDLNDLAETTSIWDAIDGGAPVPGAVAVGAAVYNVDQFETDVESKIDYGGGGGNFGGTLGYASINGDGPGGGGGGITGGDDFSVRADTHIAFKNPGTYSLAVVSDDGRRVELTAAELASGSPFGPFIAHGGQVDGGSGTGTNLLVRNGTTGHAASVGVFEAAAGDVLFLDAYFFERGGGDSFEIAIKAGSDTGYGGPGDGWQLLQQGVVGIGLASDQTFVHPSTDTSTLQVKITGENDAPTVTPPGIGDVTIQTSSPQATVALFPSFEDVDGDDVDTALTYTVTGNTDAALIQPAAVDSADGLLVLDTPCTLAGSADITVRATDGGGLWVEDTFTVTVVDDVAPECPPLAKLFVTAPAGQTSAVVSWPDVVMVDKVDGPIVASCNPPSGSTFGWGATPVVCTAIDAAGNTAECTFLVAVRLPDDIVLQGPASSLSGAVAGGAAPGGGAFTQILGAHLAPGGQVLIEGEADGLRGLWSGELGALSLLAKEGGALPGTAGTPLAFDRYTLSATGDAGFRARLAGVARAADEGHWRVPAGGAAAEVALEGGAAPGTGGAVYSRLHMQGWAMNDLGEYYHNSVLFKDGLLVTEETNAGIWSAGGGLLLREGDAVAALGGGAVHGRFNNQIAANDAGEVAFDGWLRGGGISSGVDNTGVFAGSLPSPDLVAQRGEAAPTSGAAGSFDRFPWSVAINGGGDVAFLAQLAGPGVGASDNDGIWAEVGGALQEVAREGAPAPGFPGATFAEFSDDIHIVDSGAVVFGARVQDLGLPLAATEDEGVFAWVPGSGLRLLAGEGMVAPGTAGVWANLPGFVAHEGGEVAFNGTLRFGVGGVTRKDDHGVWAAASAAAGAQLVVRSGEDFADADGDGDDELIHRVFLSESADGGAAGRSSALACGNLAVVLTYDQNRQSTVWIMGVPAAAP